MKIGSCAAAAAIGLLLSLPQTGAATAIEIRVIASPGISTVLKELVPHFEQTSGHTVTIRYGLVPAQKREIEAGDFDLAIVPSPTLDEEIKRGKIVANSRTVLAGVGLGVGVRAGTPKPDVSTLDAFKRAMLDAKSVSYVTDEPTGQKITAGFERLGIADQMKAKTKPEAKVGLVWQAVASGEAQMGFGFASNALAVPGIEIAGLFPAELQYAIEMTAGIGALAKAPEAAGTLVKYLLSAESAAVLKAKGLTPRR